MRRLWRLPWSAQLILQAGGHVEGEMIDVVIPAAAARTARARPIGLSHREVRRILGATEDGRGVEQETTESVLQALGCTLHKVAEGEYQVTLPSWRLDLEREIDLIEEIARVYGYNRFANTLPTFSGIVSNSRTPAKKQWFAKRCSAWAGTRPSPALSALLPKQLHLHPSLDLAVPWAIR